MSWRPNIRKALSVVVVNPTVSVISRTGVTPNIVTILSFLVGVGAAFLLARGWFLAGGLAILLSGGLDLLDGSLARATNRTSPYGALLDSTLDRVTEGAYFFGLLWFYLHTGGTLQVSLVYLNLLGSLLISYVRARSEGLGIQGDVGMLARGERIVLLVVGLVIGWVVLALWILLFFILVTFIQRLVYSLRKARNMQ